MPGHKHAFAACGLNRLFVKCCMWKVVEFCCVFSYISLLQSGWFYEELTDEVHMSGRHVLQAHEKLSSAHPIRHAQKKLIWRYNRSPNNRNQLVIFSPRLWCLALRKQILLQILIWQVAWFNLHQQLPLDCNKLTLKPSHTVHFRGSWGFLGFKL